jgi:uncharacterized membrane protein
MAGASLVFLLPAEIAFGVLDIDRGWGEAFGVKETVGTAVITIGSGLAFVAASRAYRRDSSFEAALWTARRAVPIVALTVVACAGFLLGLLLLVVPGLILITRWSLAWAAYSDTDSSWRGALGRSNELVRGRTWSMFGLVVVLVAGYLLIDIAAWRVVRDAADSNVLAFGFAAAAGFVVMPLQAALFFAAYERLRTQKEGSLS